MEEYLSCVAKRTRAKTDRYLERLYRESKGNNNEDSKTPKKGKRRNNNMVDQDTSSGETTTENNIGRSVPDFEIHEIKEIKYITEDAIGGSESAGGEINKDGDGIAVNVGGSGSAGENKEEEAVTDDVVGDDSKSAPGEINQNDDITEVVGGSNSAGEINDKGAIAEVGGGSNSAGEIREEAITDDGVVGGSSTFEASGVKFGCETNILSCDDAADVVVDAVGSPSI